MNQPESAIAIKPGLRTQIVASVAQHLGGRPYRLYLFGSRAQGAATPRSDYDIGILADEPLPLAMMERIRADLDDLPVLQHIELVDLVTASSDFVRQALVKSELLDEHH